MDRGTPSTMTSGRADLLPIVLAPLTDAGYLAPGLQLARAIFTPAAAVACASSLSRKCVWRCDEMDEEADPVRSRLSW
ncbi:MAG: hypothetical protein IPO25_23285 [Saprospiraceae bacterium]|nr:hypothetical protein [Saprospiraceae bacterium]